MKNRFGDPFNKDSSPVETCRVQAVHPVGTYLPKCWFSQTPHTCTLSMRNDCIYGDLNTSFPPSSAQHQYFTVSIPLTHKTVLSYYPPTKKQYFITYNWKMTITLEVPTKLILCQDQTIKTLLVEESRNGHEVFFSTRRTLAGHHCGSGLPRG